MNRVGVPWVAAFLLAAGCLGPLPPRGRVRPVGGPTAEPNVVTPPALPPASGETTPFPSTVPAEGFSPMEIPPATGPAVGLLPVFWTPAPKSDPLAAARYMAARPGLRATALFPDSYFTDDANGRQARALFLSLISSGALEVALTLPGRPVLPLLMDTDNAKSSTVPVAALPPRFAWPQDVTEQIALARAAHRRRWRSDPSVVVLPWDAVQGPELAELSKFKLRWGLMASTPGSPVLIEDDRLSLVRPSLPPAGAATRRDWWKRGPGPGLSAGATWGPVQVATLEELAAWESWLSTETFRWAKVSETVRESVSTSVVRSPLPAPDFTPWIGDNEENRAWELLGIARRAVEDVTNAGQADVRSLNLAVRAVYAAESGTYLHAFGQDADGARDADLKREFLASLNQVFQLMGKPAPPEIRNGFARGGVPTAAEGEGSFEREGATLRWRDPLHDDRGPGNYFYPTGSQYETGTWDLRVFDVTPTTDAVVLGFEFAALPNPLKAPLGFSYPLIDVYIDINHSPGAGAQELLPGRPGLVESQDAWEYALSIDGWGARLSQFVLGGAPRAVATLSGQKTGAARFAVTVPRRYLRGDPDGWGFAVAVMGRAPPGGPMAVGSDPGAAQFGGADAADRPAPPYIDLLTPEGVSQRRTLGVYRQGQDPTLPFVRAE